MNEIEELAETIISADKQDMVTAKEIAIFLHNAGYRKAPETSVDLVEKVADIITGECVGYDFSTVKDGRELALMCARSILKLCRPELKEPELCGAYAECWEELGYPKGWKGCSLPKGHEGNHTDQKQKGGNDGHKQV